MHTANRDKCLYKHVLQLVSSANLNINIFLLVYLYLRKVNEALYLSYSVHIEFE